MTTPESTEKRDPKRTQKERQREERHHDKAMKDTFPASDPPATTQPGSGITGPEVIDEKKKPS